MTIVGVTLASLVALALVSAASLAATLRLRRVVAAVGLDAGRWASALARGATRADLEVAVGAWAHDRPTWVADLVDDLLAARSGDARVAAVNEHLGDLAAALAWGEAIGPAARRVATLGPLAVGFALLASGHAEPQDALAAAVWALPGAAWTTLAARRAASLAGATREGVDRLVARLVAAAARPAGGVDRAGLAV